MIAGGVLEEVCNIFEDLSALCTLKTRQQRVGLVGVV